LDVQQRSRPGDEEPKRLPKTLNETVLDLTLKWIERSSEASELAVNDTKLAEVQAQAIARFFTVVRQELAGCFDEPGGSP